MAGNGSENLTNIEENERMALGQFSLMPFPDAIPDAIPQAVLKSYGALTPRGLDRRRVSCRGTDMEAKEKKKPSRRKIIG